jgi:nifR3 family TIM-barrel protein
VLRIGPIELDSPAVQAALSGYSDWPMRVLARRYGAPYTIHEVMLERFAREVKATGRRSHHLRVTDEEHPVGAQLMGSEPAEFGPAALRLVDAGFDVIDINFGCPVRSAMGGCRGGYHLGRPDIALEIIRRVRDAVPCEIPVTVKMRRGIDDTAASRDRFYEILDGAFALGAAAVTVHARTVEQKYVGRSRWEFLREVKQHAGERIILGSGDLFSADDCLAMLQQTGVNGLSVARGAIGNPWIFRQVRALLAGEPHPLPPDVHEQREAIREHLALAREAYGERCFSTIRKFAIKYARLHPEHEAVRNAFARAKSLVEWEQTLTEFYGENAPGAHPQVDEVAAGSMG